MAVFGALVFLLRRWCQCQMVELCCVSLTASDYRSILGLYRRLFVFR
jgi:hypothetical protein